MVPLPPFAHHCAFQNLWEAFSHKPKGKNRIMRNGKGLIADLATDFLGTELEGLNCRCISEYSSVREHRTRSRQSEIHITKSLCWCRDPLGQSDNQVVDDNRACWKIIVGGLPRRFPDKFWYALNVFLTDLNKNSQQSIWPQRRRNEQSG